MPGPKVIHPEALAKAKQLYVETRVPVADICAMLGIGTHTFHQRLKEWGWPLRSKRIPVEAPPAETEPDAADLAPGPAHGAPPSRARTARLVALLQDATERELTKLDRIAERAGEESENLRSVQETLRAKASASRMLRELILMQDMTGPDVNDDGFPRSDDELRRELLRKMDALIARRKK